MVKVCIGLLSCLFLSACGDTNFNEILLTSDSQKEAIDQLLIEARYEYDKGNVDEALELAEKAYTINPYGEETLILKANIYLSQAGLDAFGIADRLINDDEGKSQEGDKTASAFSALADIMNLSTTDYDAMADSSQVDGTTIKILYPRSAVDARERGSPVLTTINDAIATLCPLIQDSAKMATDTRHQCEKSPNIQKLAKSHFAWSLAHLGEAIAFYTVVLFDNDNGTPNIQDAINGVDRNNIAALVSRLSTVTTAINSIFPTGATAESSMLNAMFNNLDTTNKGFSTIAGIPESVTKKVSDAISNLKTKVSSIGSQGSGTDAVASKQNEALRNSLTTGMSTQLKSKIEAANNLSDQDKIKACCAYRAINSQAPTPSNCTTVTATQCTQAN